MVSHNSANRLPLNGLFLIKYITITITLNTVQRIPILQRNQISLKQKYPETFALSLIFTLRYRLQNVNIALRFCLYSHVLR